MAKTFLLTGELPFSGEIATGPLEAREFRGIRFIWRRGEAIEHRCVARLLPGTVWLTKEKRIDRDYALFGEVSYDITPQFTVTGGGRYYNLGDTVSLRNGTRS